MWHSDKRQTATIICLILSFTVLTSGYRILDPGESLPPRTLRARPMTVVSTSDMMASKLNPDHDNFLKQLINYLEIVGRRK